MPCFPALSCALLFAYFVLWSLHLNTQPSLSVFTDWLHTEEDVNPSAQPEIRGAGGLSNLLQGCIFSGACACNFPGRKDCWFLFHEASASYYLSQALQVLQHHHKLFNSFVLSGPQAFKVFQFPTVLQLRWNIKINHWGSPPKKQECCTYIPLFSFPFMGEAAPWAFLPIASFAGWGENSRKWNETTFLTRFHEAVLGFESGWAFP